MYRIGRSYPLEVVKRVEFGVYLDAGNLGEILLPNRVAPEGLEIGDSVKAFLYLDSEDRPIATTKRPRVQVGQFAYLQVVETTHFGAFLDWGLDKHLLVPFAEQHVKMLEGKSYLVYVYQDRRDGRIVASSKVDKFIDDDKPHRFKPRQEVSLIIANSTELGFKAIVNHSHWGVLYKNDVFQRLSFGQSVKGYIQQVRADGRIDLTLNGGYKARDKNCQTILDYLKKQGGYAALHDKSDPAEISAQLGMSKAAFKKAIGGLYKQQVITIEEAGIRLIAGQS
ncbi:CvfB family protein [Saccharophagus degradans]|uniref:RNA binding S1 n=1 Tax=Saccharophagus degradans (strain 2-40 / ATCC 43961 / DSM 17024) TaxID=203122 RepID=Q21KJ9_SACD2|nr:S1-like domain-containing RNA-binding protein [Saccharophagus degradans]ABD80780.1 RNA binding S1 [Saccharophagus degradans 2-40]WGO97031.1 S1-like domain-containing RNA-binding protein [Saccharophagus degradans]